MAASWFKRWLVLAALWSIPGIIQATSTYAVYVLKGDDSMPLATTLLWRIPEWQVWAFATPLILWAGRRWPPARGSGWIKTIPIHVAFATAIMTLDIIVYFVLGRELTNDPWFNAPLLDALPFVLLKS